MDLASKHIQPRSSNQDKSGFHQLIPDDSIYEDIPAETIFKEDFSRFKALSPNEAINSWQSRLYRVNDCTYEKLTDFPISVNVIAELQPNGQLQISTSLSGFKEEDNDLVVNSGALRHINEELNKQQDRQYDLTPQDYCKKAQDYVLPEFFTNSGTLDIEKYIQARDKKKTGYNSQKTAGIVGAIYLPQNKGRLLEWLRRIPTCQPILWMPSSAIYWSASAYAKLFYEELRELLEEKRTMLSLIFPNPKTKQDSYELGQKFKGLVDNKQCLSWGAPLDEMEIMVVPGAKCWGMIQYHARIPARYNLRNIRIPIGYTTYDTERVKNIFSILLEKAHIKEGGIVEPLDVRYYKAPEIMEGFIQGSKWLVEKSNGESSTNNA